ncbi:helix-turn-helix transcriptional regulator [Oryzifoliimicrobium ureilyticus]|uniref:helix-turn-helix transcriptional regulator n=1 Tax=Oryzifoliimicrobium ureilyticus TaxID=3113724 RepID=UPI0030763832
MTDHVNLDHGVGVGNRLDAKAGSEDTQASLAAMTRRFGYSYFVMSRFPVDHKTGFLLNCMLTNWPQPLQQIYDKSEIFPVSRIVTSLKRTIMPVFFNEDSFCVSVPGREKRVEALFISHGLRRTAGLSLHDAQLSQYLFAFSGMRPALERAESEALVFACMELLDHVVNTQAREPAFAEPLSRREVECLRWTASGKSSDEIAIILSLSPHTVVGYMKSAMRKLNASNRMQAVAQAVRHRLI